MTDSINNSILVIVYSFSVHMTMLSAAQIIYREWRKSHVTFDV